MPAAVHKTVVARCPEINTQGAPKCIHHTISQQKLTCTIACSLHASTASYMVMPAVLRQSSYLRMGNEYQIICAYVSQVASIQCTTCPQQCSMMSDEEYPNTYTPVILLDQDSLERQTGSARALRLLLPLGPAKTCSPPPVRSLTTHHKVLNPVCAVLRASAREKALGGSDCPGERSRSHLVSLLAPRPPALPPVQHVRVTASARQLQHTYLLPERRRALAAAINSSSHVPVAALGLQMQSL
eukprot:6486058-Amphidinium_carterae.1